MMKRFQINLRRLCVALVGAVFFVSGILKLMDPVGTSLIVAEYLKFLRLSFMIPASKAIGVALALVETLSGAAMLAGLWRRVMSYLVLIMMGAYTLLTVALVIFNPAMDCGCFGEALHLSHGQSLVKNLALLTLALIGYVPFRTGEKPRTAKFVVFGLVAALVTWLCVYSLRNIPLVDFTEYRPATELGGSWSSDESAGAPVLSFTDQWGQYMDGLALDGDVLVCSVHDPQALGWKDWAVVSQAVTDALCAGLQPLLLTPWLDGVPSDLVDYVYFADYKELVTLNRSNGGYTLISDGMIVSKWARRHPQGMEQLAALEQAGYMETCLTRTVYGRIRLQGIMLVAAVALLII